MNAADARVAEADEIAMGVAAERDAGALANRGTEVRGVAIVIGRRGVKKGAGLLDPNELIEVGVPIEVSGPSQPSVPATVNLRERKGAVDQSDRAVKNDPSVGPGLNARGAKRPGRSNLKQEWAKGTNSAPACGAELRQHRNRCGTAARKARRRGMIVIRAAVVVGAVLNHTSEKCRPMTNRLRRMN